MQLEKPSAMAALGQPGATLVDTSSWVAIEYYDPGTPNASYPAYQFDFPNPPTIDLGTAYDIILVPEDFVSRIGYGTISSTSPVTGPGTISTFYQKAGPSGTWNARSGLYLSMTIGYMRTNSSTPVDISSTIANKFSCSSMSSHAA
jgi:hypothetical protein